MLSEDLVIGQRNYHYEGNPAGSILPGDITVLSDELGDRYTFIRCYSLKYGLTYLEIGPDAIRFVLNNGQVNEQYFVAQTLYIDDGTFISNEGFVNDKNQAINGLIVYTSDLQLTGEEMPSDGEQAGDASGQAETGQEPAGLSLINAWATRFDNGLTYNGAFDAEGKTTVVTPEELAAQGQVCYAVQETPEETPDHIFTGEEFGLFTVWDE